MEYQSPEDKDFIVDDGYKHDEDPDYVPEKEESYDDEKIEIRLIKGWRGKSMRGEIDEAFDILLKANKTEKLEVAKTLNDNINTLNKLYHTLFIPSYKEGKSFAYGVCKHIVEEIDTFKRCLKGSIVALAKDAELEDFYKYLMGCVQEEDMEKLNVDMKKEINECLNILLKSNKTENLEINECLNILLKSKEIKNLEIVKKIILFYMTVDELDKNLLFECYYKIFKENNPYSIANIDEPLLKLKRGLIGSLLAFAKDEKFEDYEYFYWTDEEMEELEKMFLEMKK